MIKWLDTVPMFIIAIPALFIAILPVTPQPHLVEKLTMLISGTLTKPIDVFDLIFHGSLLIILGIKIVRSLLQYKRQNTG